MALTAVAASPADAAPPAAVDHPDVGAASESERKANI